MIVPPVHKIRNLPVVTKTAAHTIRMLQDTEKHVYDLKPFTIIPGQSENHQWISASCVLLAGITRSCFNLAPRFKAVPFSDRFTATLLTGRWSFRSASYPTRRAEKKKKEKTNRTFRGRPTIAHGSGKSPRSRSYAHYAFPRPWREQVLSVICTFR